MKLVLQGCGLCFRASAANFLVSHVTIYITATAGILLQKFIF